MTLFVRPWLQHTVRCPSLSPGVCLNSCPLSQWCYLTISYSAALFFCLQSFPASGSFPVSQLFTSGEDFPGGSDGKASVYNAGDPGLIPGSGRSPGEGNGNRLIFQWVTVVNTELWISSYHFLWGYPISYIHYRMMELLFPPNEVNLFTS